MQRSDVKRVEFMEEMHYNITTNIMIVWLDETGSDRRDKHRKQVYQSLYVENAYLREVLKMLIPMKDA
jgi:hypothetical protein